ncbi:MAG: MFS transporter [Inquilinaceae bacterium]
MALGFGGALRGDRPRDGLRRGTIIGVIAFLTLIDLFGSQALLPRLVTAYGVDAATMGFAVNASTIGMAAAGLAVAFFSNRIDRKKGLWVSLALLSIPTALLGIVDDVTLFMVLRILQGVFMATAFTLTMTYLSEQCDLTAAGGAMAAYITGNVASNLFGRLMAATLADWGGLSVSFFAFAALNLVGAVLAFVFVGASSPDRGIGGTSPVAAWAEHLRAPGLRAAFLIGFLLLFVFVGVFTYVNLELVGPRFSLAPVYLGLVYFVFLPALFTTPMAGPMARRFGARPVFWASGAVAFAGLVMLLSSTLALVLIGLALIGVGTFFAQAAATGYVGRTARRNHAAANGLYLTSYYGGGLVGALALGQIYTQFGWTVCVGAIIAAMLAACLLAIGLSEAGGAAQAPAQAPSQ